MNLKQSILSTLAYHDIFNYPLTAEEVNKFQIKKSTVGQTKKTLKKLIGEKKVGESHGLYFLGKKVSIAQIRKNRQKISAKKIKRAKFYASILRLTPQVKLVAVTGALAMRNSTASDDIDFLIITQKNLLWTTRFMANMVLFPFKRDPKSSKQKDKACLNMFLDESALSINEHNLYTAHEICQLKLLWDRNNTYQKFIKSNNWVRSYLPNWEPTYQPKAYRSNSHKSVMPSINLSKVEILVKNFQLKYMSSKITTEKIGDRQLFFHPKNTQEEILKKYHHLTKKYL